MRKSPSDAERKQIEEAANKKAQEKLFVDLTEMDRKAAEDQYAKEPVNGQNIYEKRRPPESLVRASVLNFCFFSRTLSIFRILVTNLFIFGLDQVEYLKYSRLDCCLRCFNRFLQEDKRSWFVSFLLLRMLNFTHILRSFRCYQGYQVQSSCGEARARDRL